MSKAGRRGFLKALGISTAALAATTVAPAQAATQTVERVVEKEVWPDFLPALVGQPSIDPDETRRLLRELLNAERELFTIPEAEDLTWNGLSFRLAKGPNVVPAPIAYVYRLAVETREICARDLANDLRRKYRHTFKGL